MRTACTPSELMCNFKAMPRKREPVSRKKRAETPPAPEEMRDLPTRVRDCITEQETSATAIAELAGLSTPAVTRLQRGEQFEGIKAASVIRIAKALGVRPAWLLLGEEPKFTGGMAAASDPESVKLLAKLIASEMKSKAPGS